MAIDRRTMLTAAAAAAATTAIKDASAATIMVNNQPGARHQRWTAAEANRWYKRQPWLVGCNFLPSTAVNQLEMFQAATFDPATIDRELGWSAAIGMNTVRVFLHNLLWSEDPAGFISRLDRFLAIAASHRIRPMLVLFDSCWNPFPKPGPQPAPRPGIHNSQWVQAPGAMILQDPGSYDVLEDYVTNTIAAFANDPRVLAWDVWNEPDNTNGSSYGYEEPADKVALVNRLLPRVFLWARLTGPTQPLTSPLWAGNWSKLSDLNPTQLIQIENSDIITFHNYNFIENFISAIDSLRPYGRPVLCSEYMARNIGSLFDECIPAAYQADVAAINWGCVSGKSQTYIPWDSWQHPYTTASAYGGTTFQTVVQPNGTKPVRPYTGETPPVWQHDIFYPDGTPYRAFETRLIRRFAVHSGRRSAQSVAKSGAS